MAKLEQDVNNEDKYGCLLKYVWAENTMVNYELVRM